MLIMSQEKRVKDFEVYSHTDDYMNEMGSCVGYLHHNNNNISFRPQIAYKLIEAGRSKDILKVQGLSIDGLNDNEDTIIQ